MFSIFKKKYNGKIDLSALQTDMHSHLLPGIDDGATDVNNSIELIKGLEDLGYQKFITTPHIFQDMYKNDAESIGRAYDILAEEKTRLAIDTPITAAAEYYLDDHFDTLLANKTPLLTLKDNLVLVEFSFINAPINYKSQLFQLQIQGYQPVLAHPERYIYLDRNRMVYDELKDAGCLLQLNILSLAGHYGRPTQELAQYLLKKQYINFLGTDLHHLRHLDALRNAAGIMPLVNDLLQSGRLLNPSL
jgi:tyrosine-protein phosphatase YwqE